MKEFNNQTPESILIRTLLIAGLALVSLSVACGRKNDNANTVSIPENSQVDRYLDFKPSGVTIPIIKGWDVSIEGKRAKMFAPDRQLTAFVYASPEKSFEDAQKKAIEQVATFVDSARTDGTSIKWEVGDGLSAMNEKGVGVKDGTNVAWGTSVINTPVNPLQVVWYADAGGAGRDADLAQMRMVLGNIRKITNVKRSANTFTVE